MIMATIRKLELDTPCHLCGTYPQATDVRFMSCAEPYGYWQDPDTTGWQGHPHDVLIVVYTCACGWFEPNLNVVSHLHHTGEIRPGDRPVRVARWQK